MGDMTGEDVTAAEGGAPAARPTPRVPMRERIVEAATELFYAQGLRAVSAEKIIAQVGITKVTFYRHFPTKDDLIVAYLERRAKWERDAIAQARQAAGDVPGVFRILAEAIGAESCSPGFRGCPFINAAAEYADPEHPGAAGGGRPPPLVQAGHPGSPRRDQRPRLGAGRRPDGDAARRSHGQRLPQRSQHRRRCPRQGLPRDHRIQLSVTRPNPGNSLSAGPGPRGCRVT